MRPLSSAARLSGGLVLGLAIAGTSPAQSVLHRFVCPGCDRGEASSVAAVGDVDGDGTPDVAVAFALQAPSRGLVRVHSGASGDVVREWTIDDIGADVQVAGGDVDADGHADVVVGLPLGSTALGQTGYVRVFSGRTSQELLAFDGAPFEFLGMRVASGADLDADGHDDVLALVEGCIDPIVCDVGVVRAYSGRTGALLHEVVGVTPASLFGYGLDGLGDVDGDGREDYLVSDAAPAGSGSGVVHVISGGDGTTLRSITSPHGLLWFGRDAASVGDVTGDGVEDVAVTSSVSHALPARVDVFSGADGGHVWTAYGDPVLFDFFGAAVAGVPDATGDGVPDVVVGAPLAGPPSGAGAAYLISGSDGAVQHAWRGGGATERMGTAVDGVADLDVDGLAELVVGTRWDAAQSGEPGVALVLSGGALRAPLRSCAGAPNSVGPGGSLHAAGTRSIADDDLVIAAEGMPTGTFALLVRGPSPARFPFGDGYLCVDPFSPGLTRVLPVRPVDASGGAAWPIDLATATAPAAGESWTFQALYRDVAGGGAGFNGTDALTATFVP